MGRGIIWYQDEINRMYEVQYVLSNPDDYFKLGTSRIDIQCPVHNTIVRRRLSEVIRRRTSPCNDCLPFIDLPMNRHRKLNACKDVDTSKPRVTLGALYSSFQHDGIRKLKNTVTFDEWVNLVKQPCFYCGAYNNPNGIDRVDSDDYYHIDNVVPCCKHCNYLKLNDTLESFINRLGRLSKRVDDWRVNLDLIKYHEIERPNNFPCTHVWRAAKQRGIQYTITKGHTYYLLSLNCLYCGDKSTGLDRLDNNSGYVLGNVAPCCRHCNTGKRTLKLSDFEAHIRQMREYRIGLF